LNRFLEIALCNDAFVKFAGYKESQKVIGKCDDDFKWHKFSCVLKKHDIDALNGKTYTSFIQLINNKNESMYFSVFKIADIDEYDEVVRIHCLFLPISKLKYPSLPLFAEKLTYRETQCLLYLMIGESAKLISKHLCVSFRTVEKYIGSLRYKLYCKNREELIEKAYKYNLFYFFFLTIHPVLRFLLLS